MNVRAWLVFELAYYDAVVLYISHHASGTPSYCYWESISGLFCFVLLSISLHTKAEEYNLHHGKNIDL